MSLADLPSQTKDLVAEVVTELLHDWIKYMEMRLLSVDWTRPSADVSRHLHRGLEETRRSARSVEGVMDIWGRGRMQLAPFQGDDSISSLIATLDAQSEAVCALLNWTPEQLAADSREVETRIKAPGKTLRAARDALAPDL